MEIGLEYILNLNNMRHIELAERLGIKKQNINLWIKGKQSIPKKYLPELSKIFGIEEKYFNKDLNELDKIEIQTQKLIRDLNAKRIDEEEQFNILQQDLVQIPRYDNDEINGLIVKKEKVKLLGLFNKLLDGMEDSYKLLLVEQAILLLHIYKKNEDEHIISDTLDALSHYYNILPDWVGVGEENSDKFISDLTEIFSENDRKSR